MSTLEKYMGSKASAVVPLVAGALLTVSLFLPWLTASAPFIGTVNRSGMDLLGADGTLLLLGGLALAVTGGLALARPWKLAEAAGTAIVGGLLFLLSAYDYSQAKARVSDVAGGEDVPLIASVGLGAYLAVMAGFACACTGVAAVIHLRSRPTQTFEIAPTVPSEPAARTFRTEAPAGWQPDPALRHQLRYWDGSAWTPHVSDNGQVAVDPL